MQESSERWFDSNYIASLKMKCACVLAFAFHCPKWKGSHTKTDHFPTEKPAASATELYHQA